MAIVDRAENLTVASGWGADAAKSVEIDQQFNASSNAGFRRRIGPIRSSVSTI